MVYRVGIENNIEGRSLAWALGHPGCYRYGVNGAAAIAGLDRAVSAYAIWTSAHLGRPSWVSSNDIEVRVDDTWDGYVIDESYERVANGYEINAWFLDDWKPLSALDVERGSLLLAWSRADLLATVAGLPEALLDRTIPAERWTIQGIVGHVGTAEWWYLDRLGLAFPREQLPQDPMQRLQGVRQHIAETLPRLVDARLVVGTDGEIWSPRKLLRRAVWHERDHTDHIRRLLGRPAT